MAFAPQEPLTDAQLTAVDRLVQFEAQRRFDILGLNGPIANAFSPLTTQQRLHKEFVIQEQMRRLCIRANIDVGLWDGDDLSSDEERDRNDAVLPGTNPEQDRTRATRLFKRLRTTFDALELMPLGPKSIEVLINWLQQAVTAMANRHQETSEAVRRSQSTNAARTPNQEDTEEANLDKDNSGDAEHEENGSDLLLLRSLTSQLYISRHAPPDDKENLCLTKCYSALAKLTAEERLQLYLLIKESAAKLVAERKEAANVFETEAAFVSAVSASTGYLPSTVDTGVRPQRFNKADEYKEGVHRAEEQLATTSSGWIEEPRRSTRRAPDSSHSQFDITPASQVAHSRSASPSFFDNVLNSLRKSDGTVEEGTLAAFEQLRDTRNKEVKDLVGEIARLEDRNEELESKVRYLEKQLAKERAYRMEDNEAA